ncbi:hypothetical protein JK359_07385 [Streptomyces actinomycinicus]|uniref:Uncharacterized protein n=1 Tax=Streptomyces actinomycinicus TaxID=1695166 RepID=A0A937JKW7_9ACTN|nr:hypothetical protein [Streptomyces actinomycinicus]MBL1081805.1 hypothetical protein [Streptomyces actinomycinicus]
MQPTEKAMVPRPGLRIDLVPRELHLGIIGIAGATLAMRVGADLLTVLPPAFLVSVRVRVRRIQA